MTGRRAAALRGGLVAVALIALTATLALTDAPASTPLRRAYLIPVLSSALWFGLPGGVVAATAALLLDAVLLLPTVERAPEAAGEAVATFGGVTLVGVVAGLLVSRARRRHARYETLLAVQRALAGTDPLDTALRRLRVCLERRLGACAVALAVREGDRLLVAAPDHAHGIAPGSAVDRVLVTGRPLFVPDAGGGPRPRRVFVVPLGGQEPIGALAMERVGELDADERGALETLGVHVGLALTNARLASRQRRFADELAEKVAAATRRLEEADRAKSAFVAVASHELRTPLTALKGFGELLAVRTFTPAEVRRLAEIMCREIDRLVRIVSDLLDLSRLERGAPPALRRAAVAVEPALTSAVALLQRTVPARAIVVQCATGLPLVDADPDALDRIVKNLISNAIKYSAAGDAIRVGARPGADAGSVEFSVEDGGRGIPADALPHVFEPYYRAADAAGAAHGDGIGLAVVKGLVEAHGGAIMLESTENIGTRVTFRLPAAAPSVP